MATLVISNRRVEALQQVARSLHGTDYVVLGTVGYNVAEELTEEGLATWGRVLYIGSSARRVCIRAVSLTEGGQRVLNLMNSFDRSARGAA